MADIKRDEHPAMIPGYGQPPEGVRTDHPDLPDQGNRWGAETEGKPSRERDAGSQGQNVEKGPDVPTPSRTEPDVPMPNRTPVEGP